MAGSKKAQTAWRVGDVLKNVVAKLDDKLCTEDEIIEVWAEVVGSAGGRHSKPVSLRQKVLRVHVDSSAWIHSLTLNKRKCLKKLQTRFGKDKITDIRFRVGELAVPAKDSALKP